MTLPDSECKRIKQDALKWYPETMDSLEMQTRRAARINGANTEASLWYERMGKFAEWYSDNFNGVPDDYEAKEGEQVLTTPELINEFLQQENKQK